MIGHDVVVIGASAGGVETLSQLVRDLPLDLPAAIFIVLHLPTHGTSALPNILSRCGVLKAFHPDDGQEIQPGNIYIAPPDYHLLIKPGHIHLVRGPRENNHRPAIDPLFRSAAIAYGRRVVGVILSGVLDDGTAGLMAVKARGGVAIAQNPDEAMYSGMPRSAIENVEIDEILSIKDLAPALLRWANEPVEGGAAPMSSDLEQESDIAEMQMSALDSNDKPGVPSNFGCPDCGGTLWEIKEGKLIRFRCRIGHAYSADTLLAKQSDALEDALWVALRALEESASLAQRLAQRSRDRGHSITTKRFEEQAESNKQRAALIRDVLLKGEIATSTEQARENGKNGSMLTFPIVAIAASAGGLKAIQKVLEGLPKDFAAAIVIVQHLDPHTPSRLSEIFASRHKQLTIKQAKDGDVLIPGRIYIAPPNKHLLVEAGGKLALTDSERIKFFRPSADVLFESVAKNARHQAIAVVLTGSGSDGTSGVLAIKKMGGIVIVQDPATCESSRMPQSAIDTGAVDFIVPLNAISQTLVELVDVEDGIKPGV